MLDCSWHLCPISVSDCPFTQSQVTCCRLWNSGLTISQVQKTTWSAVRKPFAVHARRCEWNRNRIYVSTVNACPKLVVLSFVFDSQFEDFIDKNSSSELVPIGWKQNLMRSWLLFKQLITTAIPPDFSSFLRHILTRRSFFTEVSRVLSATHLVWFGNGLTNVGGFSLNIKLKFILPAKLKHLQMFALLCVGLAKKKKKNDNWAHTHTHIHRSRYPPFLFSLQNNEGLPVCSLAECNFRCSHERNRYICFIPFWPLLFLC